MNILNALYPSLPFRARLRGKPKSFDGGDLDPRGEETFSLIEDVGIKPTDDVLDIGCASGRMARPLLKFLSQGSYRGFDIVAKGIESANKEIGLYFDHIDAYNMVYNPLGKVKDDQVTFPYAESKFSFVFANSIFTHMLPEGVERYLTEIKRVAKPGLRSYLTFFLLTEESLRRLDQRKAAHRLPHVWDGYRTLRKHIGREGVVAYEEKFISQMIARAGLRVDRIVYGSWSGIQNATMPKLFQDIIVVTKP